MHQKSFLKKIILPAAIVCCLIFFSDVAYSAFRANAGDLFGYSVSMWDNNALIAAPYTDTNKKDGGQAYLFDSRQELRHKLIGEDNSEGNTFANVVSMRDGSIVIGAINADRQGKESGEAYIFNTKGKQLHSLIPDNGAAGDLFGSAVAVRGRYAIIGAPYSDRLGKDSGIAYLFDTVEGKQIRELIAEGGATGDLFGSAVALNDSYALVGAPSRDDRAKDSGAAYLFDLRSGKQLQKLTADDTGLSDSFGYSVSLNDRVALVGAPYSDRRGKDAGGAYLFQLADGKQIRKINPDSGDLGDLFGYSVAINSSYAIVSAPYNDRQGKDSGTVYSFHLKNDRQLAQFAGEDVGAGDLFGYDVAVYNDFVLVGAPYGDNGEKDNGSAYLFNVFDDRQVAQY
jgi:hypothetical protein